MYFLQNLFYAMNDYKNRAKDSKASVYYPLIVDDGGCFL